MEKEIHMSFVRAIAINTNHVVATMAGAGIVVACGLEGVI